ncbi:MAG: DUF3298 domain-containing protein [bacterium]
MKKQIIIIGILVVIAIIFGVIADRAPKQNPIPNKPIQQADTVHMVTIDQQTDYAIASGTYPQFTNASASFNQKITDVVQTAIAEQFKNSQDNWQARIDTRSPGDAIPEHPTDADKFPITISADIIRNDSIISVLLHINEFSGGAHGQELLYTYNYDVAQKTEITLDTFIQKDSQFLQKLSAVSRTMLRTQLAKSAQIKESEVDTDMLNSGTTPTVDNFSLFTLPNDTTMAVYFSQYQVGPYVYGSPQITINLPLK